MGRRSESRSPVRCCPLGGRENLSVVGYHLGDVILDGYRAGGRIFAGYSGRERLGEPQQHTLVVISSVVGGIDDEGLGCFTDVVQCDVHGQAVVVGPFRPVLQGRCQRDDHCVLEVGGENHRLLISVLLLGGADLGQLVGPPEHHLGSSLASSMVSAFPATTEIIYLPTSIVPHWKSTDKHAVYTDDIAGMDFFNGPFSSAITRYPHTLFDTKGHIEQPLGAFKILLCGGRVQSPSAMSPILPESCSLSGRRVLPDR